MLERFQDVPLAHKVMGLYLPTLPAGKNIFTASADERRDALARLRAGLPRCASEARSYLNARKAEAREHQR
jgi:hypothetical protein